MMSDGAQPLGCTHHRRPKGLSPRQHRPRRSCECKERRRTLLLAQPQFPHHRRPVSERGGVYASKNTIEQVTVLFGEVLPLQVRIQNDKHDLCL